MTSPLAPYRPPIISRRQVETIGLYLLLTLIAILMLLPLLWLVSTSLKSPTEDIFQIPPRLLPEQPTLENFSRVWNNPGTPFISYFANSAIVAGLTVSFNLLFCSLAAYPLARLDFKGRDLLFSLVVATIMIPFQIVMIPLYVLMVKLGLKGSYLGVVLPSLASAFGIFLMRQAFQSVPKELEEAGRLDGCSELGIWWHIMIPSVRPALVTLAIFVFIGSWSDFLWPLLMLIDLPPEAHTLPIGVSLLAGSLSLDWRLVAAGSVLSIAPVVLFFLIMQRYVVPSEAASGVKG
jgi:putative chitobiose transport system permease protein